MLADIVVEVMFAPGSLQRLDAIGAIVAVDGQDIQALFPSLLQESGLHFPFGDTFARRPEREDISDAVGDHLGDEVFALVGADSDEQFVVGEGRTEDRFLVERGDGDAFLDDLSIGTLDAGVNREWLELVGGKAAAEE